MLERAGATGTTVIELPIGQHVAAIAAGQVDARYTLEPTGTIGRMNGTTRVVEAGVVAQVHPRRSDGAVARRLGEPHQRVHQEVSGRHEEVHGGLPAGVELVRTKPDEARQYMKGYTAIEGPLTSEVPLAAYMPYNEFKPSDVAYFQKFFDLFTEKGIFDKKVVVADLLYKG